MREKKDVGMKTDMDMWSWKERWELILKTAVFLINITDVRSDMSQGYSLLLTDRIPWCYSVGQVRYKHSLAGSRRSVRPSYSQTACPSAGRLKPSTPSD